MKPIKLSVDYTPATFKITLPDDQGQVIITDDTETLAPPNGVTLATQAMALVGVDTVPIDADGLIILSPTWQIDSAKVARYFQNLLDGSAKAPTDPAVAPYLNLVQGLLERFAFHENVAPAALKKPAKARHRFDKTLRERPFHVKHAGSEATVYWTAPKVMTIKQGAQLKLDPVMNKDGSERYGTKYGDKLRADHAEAIEDGVTTADIELRSVNEVGLFLYYGDTNGWLELIDDEGQTLDALTKI